MQVFYTRTHRNGEEGRIGWIKSSFQVSIDVVNETINIKK